MFKAFIIGLTLLKNIYFRERSVLRIFHISLIKRPAAHDRWISYNCKTINLSINLAIFDNCTNKNYIRYWVSLRKAKK